MRATTLPLAALLLPHAPPRAAPRLCATPAEAPAAAAPAPPHRAGFIAIVGMPNVGKSTLLNELVGERLAITTAKAQTTRHRILGIVNGDGFQVVYSDTPGVVLPQYKLHEGMMATVKGSLTDADAVIFAVDVFQQDFADEAILRQIDRSPAPLIVAVNKVDLLRAGSPLSGARLAELGGEAAVLGRWRARFPGASVLAVAAARGEGMDALRQRILAVRPLRAQDARSAARLAHLRRPLRSVGALKRLPLASQSARASCAPQVLPEHEPFFPKDQLTDRPERFFAGEMVREAIMTGYRDEVPYSTEVRVVGFKELDEIIRIKAEIYVAHESQKGIIIGAKGAALKAVGSRARKALEEFFAKQVYLETRVKVRKAWREDAGALRDFGYFQ